MTRIRIELPTHFSFCISIPIRITDINYGGHVGNDRILMLLHEARMKYLLHHGLNEMDLNGVGLIMSDVGIEFKKELFYGDEVLVFVTSNSFLKVSFDIIYKIEKKSGAQNMIVASAKTGMVCYDYSNKKVAVIPDFVREKLSGR